ncbi:response regulator [Kordiimonas pumila]|uniref:Response regulator n=1 Tax=Kordiimonas pumila TaxID=2161677 RepID=A0ABV7D3Q1_9PROT|nr:response regulator [Kordiimonas pumila]
MSPVTPQEKSDVSLPDTEENTPATAGQSAENTENKEEIAGEDEAETQPLEPALPPLATVLVLDTSTIMHRILTQMLAKSRIDTQAARKKADAMDLCHKTEFDMILVEVSPPKYNGTDITGEIRALGGAYKTVPIVAISANLTKADWPPYAEAGMAAFVKKPVNEINLLNIMRKELQLPLEKAVAKPLDDDDIHAIAGEDELSLLNWETVREYHAILKNDYRSMMEDFLVLAPSLIKAIGEAVVAGDAKKVGELAHQLKSTSLIFGAEHMSNAAAQLEIMGYNDNLADANQFYKELHMLFSRIKPALKKKLVLLHNAP